VLGTDSGEIRVHRPVAYQLVQKSGQPGTGKKHFVNSRFVLRGRSEVAFEVAPYLAPGAVYYVRLPHQFNPRIRLAPVVTELESNNVNSAAGGHSISILISPGRGDKSEGGLKDRSPVR